MTDKVSDWCGLCCRQITGGFSNEGQVITGAPCKHQFHSVCVKVRHCLQSRSLVKDFVKSKYPVCPDNNSSILEEIHKKLDKVVKIGEKLEDIKAKVTKMAGDFDILRGSVAALEIMVSKLETGVDHYIGEGATNAIVSELEERISKSVHTKAIEEIEARQLLMESQYLSDQIVVSGIPESDSENLIVTVERLGELLEVNNVGLEELISAERIGKKRNERIRRDIFVKCKTSQTVNNFINGKKQKQNLTANMLINSAPRAPIYVNRRYPPALYKLKQKLTKNYPRLKRRTWISGGAVYIRLQDDSEPIKILPSTNLESIPGLSD